MTIDDLVKIRLLSAPTDKMIIENEVKSPIEADLRLHDLVYDPAENIEEIKELIEESPNLVFEQDKDGRTPLHTISIGGDEEVVQVAKLLLGVTENSQGQVISVARGNALHVVDNEGCTPLHLTAKNWLPELTEAFLQYGASPSMQNIVGDTLLHLAAEGETDNALECAKLILQRDTDGALINAKNGKGETPLHRAVKWQALKMVQLLMGKECKLNISGSVTSSGQTILHYLCQEIGETDKSFQILETILKSSSIPQFNNQNRKGQTPLHLCAMKRLPKLTQLLVDEKRMDILRGDAFQKTALHYACQNGSYPNGSRCVEILISRQFTDVNQLIAFMFKMEDNLKNTPFMYAALNCSVDVLQKYLRRIPAPQAWITETEMLLIYKHCPLAIKGLMDCAFSESTNVIKNGEEDVEENVLRADCGPITGYVDPVEKLPQQETKYLKQSQWWDFETQKEILMHPLVQLFVVRKCDKLRWIVHSWIFWQAIWLFSYTMLVLSPTYCNDVESKTMAIVVVVFMTFYLVVSLVNEVFEMFSVGLSYILSWSNIAQLVQVILGFVAVFPVILGYDASINDRNCAAAGIILAYILSMRDAAKLHEEIGLVVEFLKQVVFQIVKVIFCCALLLIGFTFAFKIVFHDDKSLSTTFGGSMVRVFVMMTGEFDFNETFKNEEGVEKPNRATRLAIFFLFLICVPVAFFNLLTGFALDRVMELRERAKVGRISKKLEHIYFIETILLHLGSMKKLLPKKMIVDWLRKYNVTTAMIDNNLVFETLVEEKSQRKMDRRTLKGRKLDLIEQVSQFFGTELAPDVRNQMFVLANESKSKKTN